MGELCPRGRLGSTPWHTPAPILARISPLGCPDTKAADGGALGRRNRPITKPVWWPAIRFAHAVDPANNCFLDLWFSRAIS